jgi:S-adenosylmethionine-diacylglycerol 3-amino-3-carboxypropyl transferase
MEALGSFEEWSFDTAGNPATGAADGVLYGQVWEDADVLLEALDAGPGDVCLSIASAGDNTLALLGRSPARVIAIDRSRAQLSCLELRVAAFRALEHDEMLELVGSRISDRRPALYGRCRRLLSHDARDFWDRQPAAIARGIGGAGQFERYLDTFRKRVLPLVHSRERISRLIADKPFSERRRFYDEEWDTWRWRLLFHLFFSRRVMGRLGRRRECFEHVEGNVAAPILERTRYALTMLDPVENPYVHWILTGHHGAALPYALRPENFATIRDNLDRLEWRRASLTEYLDTTQDVELDRCNLSDVFEYMPEEHYQDLLGRLVRRCRPGARLAYWNMLADRRRPPSLSGRLKSLESLASCLHERDRAFFYRRLVVEEVLPCT